MAAMVLGIDISPVTVKAVLLEKKGRSGGRIIAATSVNIGNCGGIEPALKKIAADYNSYDVVSSLSLPANSVMFRQITLPFSDDGKIRKTIPFELEPLIPYSADDIIPDYLTASGGSLLVAVATKNSIREWINLAEGSLHDTPVMDISAFPLFSLLAERQALAGCGILVDIGSDSTTAIFYESNAVAGVRLFSFGGNRITEAMAEDLCLTAEEAEEIKIRGDYNHAGPATTALCRRFCLELQNTLELLKLNSALKGDPVMMTLTGGGALFAPLQSELKESFPLLIETPDFSSLFQVEIADSIKSTYNPQLMNAALASALGLSAYKRSFNFRQGEFKSRSHGIKIKEHLKKVAIIAGVIIVLAIINQFFDYRLQSVRLDNVRQEINFYFKKYYPDGAAMVEPVQQLKTKLAENKKTFGAANAGSEVTVLDLLKDISSLIPQAADIMITSFNYENESVFVKGEAKNIDAVSAAKNELMKSRYFKDVSIASTTLARQGDKVEFDLRITLK